MTRDFLRRGAATLVLSAAIVGAGGSALAAAPGEPVTAPLAMQRMSGQDVVLARVTLRADEVALLQQTLADSPSHGFTDEFRPVSPDALRSRDPNQQRAAQQQLIATTLAYAKAVHVGRLGENGFKEEWGLRPAPYDPVPGFLQAVQSDQLKTWVDSLPPPYTGYDTLRQGLSIYRQVALQGGWAQIPAGATLKVGMSDPRVAVVRARLAAEDPAVSAILTPPEPDAAPQLAGGAPAAQRPAPSAAAMAVYDQAVADAVTRAQKRFGLAPTGVLDAATRAALNVPVSQRIDQIVANMERWRWLPPELPADRIQVNVAAAILTVFQNDQPTLSMRAATGRPGDETPMLQSQVQSIVFNPPWNVPSGIAAKELWPKERAHPGYFAANDFIVIPTGDGGTRLQQKAGPKAALGQIKFDFPNPYGVYLHDTPGHGVFEKYGRLVSHGCVRLEKPVVLAKAVLGGDPTWTPDAVDTTLASGKTVRAPLPKEIAVFLLYWTAYMTPDGQVNFRGDPYGWDRELVQRIAASGGAAG